MTPEVVVLAECPRCGEQLRRRRNRKTGDTFYGCTGFPACKFTCEPFEVDEAVKRLLVELSRRAEESRDPCLPVSTRDLRRLVFEFHPDRHPDPLDPGTVCAALNRLLDRLRGAA